MPRRLLSAAATLGAALVASACMDDRDRLSTPTIILTVADSTVQPGALLGGTITAMDPNGIIYASVRLICAETDSVLAVQSNGSLAGLDSVELIYDIEVPPATYANAALFVEGAVIDDQNVLVSTRAPIAVRVPGIPAGQAPPGPGCVAP